MANVHIMDHPLIHHKLAVLRNKETPVKEFRELVQAQSKASFSFLHSHMHP